MCQKGSDEIEPLSRESFSYPKNDKRKKEEEETRANISLKAFYTYFGVGLGVVASTGGKYVGAGGDVGLKISLG